MADNFLVLVSVYALTLLGQVSYWNSFGFDRSAAQVYFSLPVPLSRALAGKNLAAALFILLEVAAVTAACLLLRVPIAPAQDTGGVRGDAGGRALPAGAGQSQLGALSARHESGAGSQGGSANRFQGLLFLLYPLALLPGRAGLPGALRARQPGGLLRGAGLRRARWARRSTGSPWNRRWNGAGARREMILAELAKGEGPVVTE